MIRSDKYIYGTAQLQPYTDRLINKLKFFKAEPACKTTIIIGYFEITLDKKCF